MEDFGEGGGGGGGGEWGGGGVWPLREQSQKGPSWIESKKRLQNMCLWNLFTILNTG